MKRNSADSPRHHKEPAIKQANLVQEMIGHFELGLVKEALVIAEDVLSSHRLNGWEFVAAVEAVMRDEDSCKAHENLVTCAYKRLSKPSQRYLPPRVEGLFPRPLDALLRDVLGIPMIRW